VLPDALALPVQLRRSSPRKMEGTAGGIDPRGVIQRGSVSSSNVRISIPAASTNTPMQRRDACLTTRQRRQGTAPGEHEKHDDPVDVRRSVAHYDRNNILKGHSMDAASERVMGEFRAVAAAAEELLGAAAGAQESERLEEVRARTEEALRTARGRLEGAGRELEEQVRRHPLAALGIAATLGIVLGVLIARK
jgi:ElaB/YqjD/DUF883 family membrane-anchored ribosome-binding protein